MGFWNKGSFGLLMCLLMLCLGQSQAGAQSQETQQLLLNLEKLSQLKNILRDMKRGYEIVSKGYSTVRDIAKGNFSLHEVFLDGLLAVSPVVKKYHKVAGIISRQKQLIGSYGSVFRGLDGRLDPLQLDYVQGVYGQLVDRSLDDLEELAMIITASKLRMNEAERLAAIDRIFEASEQKLMFLQDLSAKAMAIASHRGKEKADLEALGGLYR
jgi:hypothetical protein